MSGQRRWNLVAASDEGLVGAQTIRAEQPERVGYLLKERIFDAAILVDAVRPIADGETVIDPTIVSRLVGRRRGEDPLERLTEREREVLSLIAEGRSNRAIAAQLFVTTRTDSHRRVLAVLALLRS